MGRLAPVEVHRVGIGQDQQRVRVDLTGEQSGREVFVDHRLNAMKTIGFFHYRHAAAAVADHEMVAGDQGADRVALNDAFGLWRRHYAAKRFSVGFENPAFFRL